eukprot:CAMPEP_0181192120 /NCGR_PEP_ID=MMETSP1096-20121128/13112_1 /TAXON_ID=156174 ORGANISM="Chrysochromulina ericina, Strain CCMP281" /NCGR_SAMPLE_ID=MMETSP1096 /ASSEMBLY_ACC=CAM_ASM_000453 /LENGTH=204 /DNA_ID=CAMNT_0023281491 /DNA_START=6 /DNA_END=620 /DNA_ORIENTATION=+
MKGIASGVCGGHRFGQSIVLSGGYENDVDDGCTFEYTGEGGNDFLGSKLQTGDQRLKGGNLALANCKMHAVPVRVVRRLKSNELRYDGLYKVVAYAEELVDSSNPQGSKVFKFSMERIAGQPALSEERSVGFVGRAQKSRHHGPDDTALVPRHASAEDREYAAWKSEHQRQLLRQAKRAGVKHERIGDKEYRKLYTEQRAGGGS